MAGLELLVVFWKQWGIQALVMLSFTLQVVLLVFADMRRRIDSGVLSAFLWVAYLLADTTAIYALGHMSVTSIRSPEHQLMAFWAPFLLLHLGGQDNITAYSIEDNRLWLRHLQTFAVQVLAAGYVLYESSIIGRWTKLSQAAILMFVVGVLKYGERVWALNCASSGTLSGKNYRSFGTVKIIKTNLSPDTEMGEGLMVKAHQLLNVPKHLLKGPLPLVSVAENLYLTWEELYQVAEIQLSLMYDVFYSKAMVIYTWYGVCIRVISPLATVAAFLLFHHFSEKGGYSRVDVAATYVLLVGAVVLEIKSVLSTMFSSWVYKHLPFKGSSWFDHTLTFIYYYMVFLPRQFFHIAMRKAGIPTKYWSGSMGQHNFIHLCTHSRDNRSSKIAKWMGREDWWNTLAYTSSIPVPTDFSQLLKEQVRRSVGIDKENPDHIQNSRGRGVIKRTQLYYEELAWILDIELDESILVWHIATNVFLSWYNKRYSQWPTLAKATEAFSSYMIFLLAARPYMLPDNASRQRYIELCNKVINYLKYSSAEDLLRLIREHGDAVNTGHRPEDADNLQINITFDRASQLGAKLIELHTPATDMLELIAQVWVEMLCYVSYRCRADSHARQLSNGGEILTVVALMVEYMKSDIIGFRRFGFRFEKECSEEE